MPRWRRGRRMRRSSGELIQPRRGTSMRGNLAERAARWSAAHWKTATFGWLAFVAVAVVLGQALGTVKLSDSENSSGEPARAERALADAGFRHRAGESVLVRSPRLTADSPAFRAELGHVERDIRALPQATNVRGPLAGHPDQISSDRRAAIVQFDMRGSPETAAARVTPVLARVAAPAAGGARLHRYRVRRGKRAARTGRDDRARFLTRGEPVGAGHLPRAPPRLRRLRRRGRAGAAVVLGGARLARARSGCQPPGPCL